jgi:hypothetical protein
VIDDEVDTQRDIQLTMPSPAFPDDHDPAKRFAVLVGNMLDEKLKPLHTLTLEFQELRKRQDAIERVPRITLLVAGVALVLSLVNSGGLAILLYLFSGALG